MAMNIMDAVWKCDAPRPLRLVLLCLANFANQKGENAYPSAKRIARYCGLQEHTARIYLRRLRKLGYIEVMEPADFVMKKPPVYRILVKAQPPQKQQSRHDYVDDWDYEPDNEAFPYDEPR